MHRARSAGDGEAASLAPSWRRSRSRRSIRCCPWNGRTGDPRRPVRHRVEPPAQRRL